MPPGTTTERLVSLDAFRGLTIAGMILVNNPGSWEHVYPPLRHAAWHGWTPTDLVFPFFLFIVGVAVALALGRRVGEGQSAGRLHRKILIRSALIFGVGLLLHLFPRFDFASVRLPGVLQRIALCYLAAALLYIHSGPKARFAWALALLAGYFIIMKFIPVPGYGAGVWDYNGNLESYIDTKLLAGHLYKPEFDPEGVLSTLPAIGTTLLGTLAGDWLRTSRRAAIKTAGLLAAGVVLTVAGQAFDPYFPINKQLWTSSFVLFTAGAACLLLAACYLIMDGLGFKKWALPFIVLGTNAIAAFVGSSLMVKLLRLVNVGSGSEQAGVMSWVYQHAFVPWAGKLNGSLAFAVSYVLLWLALMAILYRKRVFIRL
jgi:predicted acyltransferase